MNDTKKKNIRLLLINPSTDLDEMLGVAKDFVQKYEPLGLLYVAAMARTKMNVCVSIIDAYAENLSSEELKKKIIAYSPDIVGISTLTASGAIVYELGVWLKKKYPQILVVLGNVHAAVYAQQYLENDCCDIVVHGEGESVILQIINYCAGREQKENIRGISFMDEKGRCHIATDDAIIEDLSTVPFPARDLLNQQLYNLSEISNQTYIAKKGTVARTMFTSRGCHNRCTFCVVHANKKQRFNDPIKVVDEMEMLQEVYNVGYVTIMDPLFMGNRERVFAICEEIKKRGLDIQWGCDAHVRYVTADLVKAMESAGCYALDFGLESGVQRLLDTVQKNITLEQAKDSIYMVKRNTKIQVGGLFILGLPGETYHDSLQTIRFAKRLPLDIAQFSILVPYPGSPLYYALAERGELDTGMREKGKVDPAVWKRYSGYIAFTDLDPIWVTGGLTVTHIRKLQKRAQREFYLRPQQILKNLKRVHIHNIGKILRILFKGFF